MKLKQAVKLSLFFILLFSVITAEAQKKGDRKNAAGRKKNIKFVTPTPIPPDHLKAELLQNQQGFFWQFEKDTSIPVSVLFREDIVIEQDSVLYKRYISKMDMNFYSKSQNVQDEEGNNIYAVYKFRRHYKIYYDVLSIWNQQTKMYDDYELKKENGMLSFDYLMSLKTKRKYKNSMNVNAGTVEGSEGDIIK